MCWLARVWPGSRCVQAPSGLACTALERELVGFAWGQGAGCTNCNRARLDWLHCQATGPGKAAARMPYNLQRPEERGLPGQWWRYCEISWRLQECVAPKMPLMSSLAACLMVPAPTSCSRGWRPCPFTCPPASLARDTAASLNLPLLTPRSHCLPASTHPCRHERARSACFRLLEQRRVLLQQGGHSSVPWKSTASIESTRDHGARPRQPWTGVV